MARYADSYDDGAFDDDYRGFEIRDDETARGPLILALAIGVLLVFGAVVWNTYRQGVRDRASGVPTVIADTQPFKRVPDERGGVVVPDTDKRFYDDMDESDRPKPVVNAAIDGDMLDGGPPKQLRPGMEPRVQGDAYATSEKPDGVIDQDRALAELDAPTPAVSNEHNLDLPDIEPPRATVVEPAKPAARFAFSSGGAYLVQIAAFRSESAAEDAWRTSSNARPDIYMGAEKRIQRADLGAKGVFYRLRAGAFDEREDAANFCDAIKQTGSNCIVVTQ